MQHSNRKVKLANKSTFEFTPKEVEEKRIRASKRHKTRRVNTGYKGAFRNIKMHEINTLLSAREID